MKTKILFIIICLFLVLLIPCVSAAVDYDVNDDGVVDYQDALEAWTYSDKPYNSNYDVNDDGVVDYQDALEIWANIGTSGGGGSGNVIIDWINDVIWG